MKEKLQQIMERELAQMPPEQREAVVSLDWPSITEQIGKKHLLTDEEIDSLQVETLIGLIGLTNTDDFITDIEDNVGVTNEEAGLIADELGEKVFSKIISKVEENVKANLDKKKITPTQNLHFILSGGDYSSFIEKRQALRYDYSIEPTKEEMQANLEKTIGLKDKLVI